MKPHYALSPPGAATNITLAAKAKQVEAWLDTLPRDDPGLGAERLADYLSAHQRPELPAALRRQLLGLAITPARRLLATLDDELHGAPLPLAPAMRRQAERAQRLLQVLGDGYKQLILEAIERRAPLFGDNPLPEYLRLLLQSARQRLNICYLTHAQAPAGLWQEAHQTYYFALVNGYADPPEQPSPASPTDLYKAMLLEAVADPYHMSIQERRWTGDIIARLGGLAQLSPAREAAHGGVYGIHSDEDRPPQPLSWQENALPDCDLVLNNTSLARHLALLANQLENAPAAAHPPAYVTLLNRLKLQWGGSMQRHSLRRQPRQPIQCELVFGFHTIFSHLAAEGHQPAPRQPAAGGPVVCQLVNESLEGMAMENAKPRFHLMIGALICVNRPNEARHDLGLVRWFKITADGLLTFGIKLLPGQPTAVRLRDTATGPTYPGLLLPINHSPTQMALTLVLPDLGKTLATPLRIVSPAPERRLQVSEKLESVLGVDLFRCHDSAPG